VRYVTPAERARARQGCARGKAARAEVTRSSNAEIDFPKRRYPLALLEEQAVSRVPELVPAASQHTPRPNSQRWDLDGAIVPRPATSRPGHYRWF
jgi:hypothetical protein